VVGRVAAGRAKLHRAPIGAQATDTMADGNLDLVIAGAGFAGMYMLHPARAMRLSARVFDAVVQKCAEAAASYQSFALS
jgi:hypothetical protein